ncbi:MAG TPA: DUF1800 domain-containing protein [Pseudonocardia sp.]|nr:DUF1800 domain-containing protein [Pseudonocardia sp.]
MISERDAVRRLLERVGLGPRPGEVDTSAAAGFESTLDRLTSAGALDTGVLATPVPDFGPPRQRLGRAAATADRKAQRRTQAQQSVQLGTWWLDRMAAVDHPYPERMTWFWHGHFATSVRKVKIPQLMHTQNETMRRLGRGDFRALAQAMIVDPAMLVWLDGGGNKLGKPNENLAREFMELFTLGVGNYTEADVRDAARALTGWKVDYHDGTATTAPRAHDPGPKTVLGTTGDLDAGGLVDLLVRQGASPRFLATRIWTRFVSDIPPDEATLDRLIGAFGPGHDVTALVSAAVREPAFRDPASALVREPVLWLVAALRALRLKASSVPGQALVGGLNGLGQVPLAPPNVGGWPAGLPWLTTAAALTRMRMGQTLAAAGDIRPVTAAAPAARVGATAALLGLPGFGARTAAALRPLADRPVQLVGLALASPEYTVSA